MTTSTNTYCILPNVHNEEYHGNELIYFLLMKVSITGECILNSCFNCNALILTDNKIQFKNLNLNIIFFFRNVHLSAVKMCIYYPLP